MKKVLYLSFFLLSYVAQPMEVIRFEAEATAFCQEEKEYSKLESTQVPADILKTASSKYSGYALKGAYVSEDKEYKLVLNKDSKTLKAYFKSTGEFIKEEA